MKELIIFKEGEIALKGLNKNGNGHLGIFHVHGKMRVRAENTSSKLHAYFGGLQRELFIRYIAFYCVPFTEIQEALRDNCPEELFTIIMRRLMMHC
mgnify:CR=1 FL=1